MIIRTTRRVCLVLRPTPQPRSLYQRGFRVCLISRMILSHVILSCPFVTFDEVRLLFVQSDTLIRVFPSHLFLLSKYVFVGEATSCDFMTMIVQMRESKRPSTWRVGIRNDKPTFTSSEKLRKLFPNLQISAFIFTHVRVFSGRSGERLRRLVWRQNHNLLQNVSRAMTDFVEEARCCSIHSVTESRRA